MKSDIVIAGMLPAVVATAAIVDGMWIGGCITAGCLAQYTMKRYFTWYVIERTKWW